MQRGEEGEDQSTHNPLEARQAAQGAFSEAKEDQEEEDQVGLECDARSTDSRANSVKVIITFHNILEIYSERICLYFLII